MIVLVILWWILRGAVVLAGSIWVLKQFAKLWDWRHRLERDGRSQYCFISPANSGTLCIKGPGLFKDEGWASIVGIYLVRPPNAQWTRLEGIPGLRVSHSEVVIRGKKEITLYLTDDHGRQLHFPVIDGDDSEAIRKLLMTAECFKERHCHCLAEARLAEAAGLLFLPPVRTALAAMNRPSIKNALAYLSGHLGWHRAGRLWPGSSF